MLKRIIVLNILESIFKQYVDFIFNISSETIRNSFVVVSQGILGRKSQWHRVFSFRIRSFTGNAERQGSISAFHTKSKLLQHHSSDRSFSPKHQGMQSHEVMTLNRTRSPAEKKDDYSFSRLQNSTGLRPVFLWKVPSWFLYFRADVHKGFICLLSIAATETNANKKQ